MTGEDLELFYRSSGKLWGLCHPLVRECGSVRSFGRSEMYMLKRVGDKTPTKGTPVLNCCCLKFALNY